MNNCIFLIFLLAMTQTSISMAQLQPAVKARTAVNRMELRKERHGLLFDKFIDGKKCLWAKDKSKLVEVRLAKGGTLPKTDFQLPDKTADVLEYFDLLVVRPSADIREVGEVTILDAENRKIPLRKIDSKEGDIGFSLPRNRNLTGSLSISISCDSEIELSEIALRSKRGVIKDFDKLKKWWLTFPPGRFSDLNQSFLQETAEMNLAELSDSLGKNSEALRMIITPARMPSSGRDISMWGIIADRRVSKIHEILSALPKETAAQIAKGNFDSEFGVFQEAWEARSLVPMQRNHGIESHLFLCSEFCSTGTFADILNKWIAWYEKHKGLSLIHI